MPATATEALKTSLMGFFQKRKFKNFLNYVIDYDQENPKTWKGACRMRLALHCCGGQSLSSAAPLLLPHNPGMDLTKVPMKKLYSYWDLDANSQDFAGHGMALHSDDSYLDKVSPPAPPPFLACVAAVEECWHLTHPTLPCLYLVSSLCSLPWRRSRR